MEKIVFNEQQRRVIEATGGHHLVLAPPGCGKTAVLAHRIAYALSQGVTMAQMACLTFTNRAARGMCERIANLQLQDANSKLQDSDFLFVGNVHRFCLHYLFNEHIVASHAAVIDTDTSMSIIADFMGDDELRVLADNRSRQQYSQIINLQHLMHQCCHDYPSELIVHREALPSAPLRQLCSAFLLPYSQQAVKQLYLQSDHYRDEPAPLGGEARHLLLMLYAAREYERYKATNDLLDFEDLLLATYESLAAHPEARRYSWLQIDEVQDLNPLQIAIIDAFTAPHATVLYLGDAQQAIFSFMGAKTDTLAMLRQRCGDDHFYNFYHNYRSPQYLLDIFNRYAQWQLNIDPALLPTTNNSQPLQPGDVQLLDAPTNVDEANMVARMVESLYHEHPDERIAVVVAFNSDADEVSAALGQLPHFKISGTDFFATAPMRLLLAHLGVLAMDHNFIAWSQLLAGLHVYASNSAARQAVRAMMQLAISPADLLAYDGSTYVAELVRAYEEQELVVFDTETTGLDVFTDDVVQIAAVRVRQGRVVDELNIFIETDRTIPPMLGDIVNPLVEEYSRRPHLQPQEAFSRFIGFAQGAVLVGHNATYDYQIMKHNMLRRTPTLSMPQTPQQPQACLLPQPYTDTLKLVRLLHPRQKSYKLRNLIEQLGLEGANTHLANDDIMATLSLLTHCYDRARSIVGRQLEFLSRHRTTAQRFRQLYGSLYAHGLQQLYEASPSSQTTKSPLAKELQHAYSQLTGASILPQLPKFNYIIKYIECDLVGNGNDDSDAIVSLAQQLARHYNELCTLKEADLCGSQSMTERVFISTVHKAKGLEFDTVVVYDAVDGKYPSAYATNESQHGEEARKFYVAISRARRRLIVTWCHNAISRWGVWHAKVLTPYMECIKSHFTRQ
jgi:DNA helicase-2/ATP-dependent DNA helicase PcrA